MKLPSSLKLVVLPGDRPEASMKNYYERTFHHWDSVWSQSLKEQDGLTRLHADNFTRQSEILALFEDLTCVAMLCYREADLSSAATRKDSYFQVWPDKAYEGLAAHGPRAVIGNQISIAPHRRGRPNQGEVGLKDLVLALSMWRLRMLDVDTMPGTMRADKNMQTMMLQAGAILLEPNIDFHHTPVDLLAFHPQVRPIHLPEPFDELLETLWQKRSGGSPLDRLCIDRPARKTTISRKAG